MVRKKKTTGEVQTGVLVVAVLLVGIAGTTLGLIRAFQAERDVRQQVENARQMSDFLVSLFEVHNPDEESGSTITAKEILDRGVERIEAEVSDQPLMQAQMMQALGGIYNSLGLYQQAQPLLEKALTIMKNTGEETRVEMVDGLLELSSLYGAQSKYTEAILLSREALLIREEDRGADSVEVAPALEQLGILLRDTGNYEEARAHLERSLALREKAQGPEHVEVARTLTELGRLLNMIGEHEEAIRCYERALSIGEKELGADHPQVAQSLSELKFLKSRREDPEKSEEALEPPGPQESPEADEPLLSTPEEVVQVDTPEAAPPEQSVSLIEPVPTERFASADVETGEFTVQIAAFRTRLQAEELLEVLGSRGYVAYIVEPVGAEAASYFRVRVGQFATQEEAREIGSDLRRSFPRLIRGFWVIPYEE